MLPATVARRTRLCVARFSGLSVVTLARASTVSADALHRLQVWQEVADAAPSPVAPAGTRLTVALAGGGDALEVPGDGSFTAAQLVGKDGGGGAPVVAARVNDVLMDLQEGILGDGRVSVELIDVDSAEGQQIMWHSAAHVLGSALEATFGDDVLLTDGPALQPSDGGGGFFYEMHMADGRKLNDELFPSIARAAKKVIKRKHRFERLVVDLPTAERMFAGNRFKLAMVRSLPPGEQLTVFRIGNFVDLCRGPHLPHTGILKSFAVTKSSGSHFDDPDGAPDQVLLQRLYGMAFPSKEAMTEWEHLQVEARRRDHRVVGKQQGLFMFHELAPGSAFMLPHGTRVYNKLVDVLREEYRRRGYDEVMTPLLYKPDLWRTSGHLDNYKEHMFMVTGGDEDGEEAPEFGLKPMNCPGHCLMFAHRVVSYRELPLRLADFSTLHRNEDSGALGGLTRLRRFQQDDGHIFCTPDQVEAEVRGCLDLLHKMYSLFGFGFRFKLSTRPEQFMGDLESWDAAEAALAGALTSGGHAYEVEDGDGAFYGPKIDVTVSDALQREHQCATIQLDFQLPRKFELDYTGEDGEPHTPVLIHRAILGSVERMMAVLIEHYGGRWPFWLSPRQVVICPVSPDHAAACEALRLRLHAAGVHVDVDSRNRTIPKRIREAQAVQYNLMVVVGDAEVAGGTAAVRFRDDATQAAAAACSSLLGTATQAALADAAAGNVSMTEGELEALCGALCDPWGHPTPPPQ